MAQARRRVYALSIYDPKNELHWDKNIRNDFSNVLIEQFLKEYKPKNDFRIKNVFDFENKNIEESLWSQIKNTPSRLRMIKYGKNLNSKKMLKVPTVTTKQDRLPNVGRINFVNERFDDNGIPYTNYRFITPLESYKLMGFTEKQYNFAKLDMLKITQMNNLKTNSSAREKLYKQAGNSIAVNVLEEIFYYVNKFK